MLFFLRQGGRTIVRLLSRFFCALPRSWALALARAVGWLWYWLIPVRVAVARKNIRRALGPLSRREERHLVRRCLQHVAMVGVETLRLPLLTVESSAELVLREGFEHLEVALARGKGVVIVGSHVGSFALFPASQAIRGVPASVILKDISYKPANDFWRAMQKRTGIHHIAPRRSKDEIRAALADNRAVVMVVDQHQPKHRAIVCEMFGQLAATSPAPARFAYETGAEVVTAVIFRRPDGRHTMRIEPFALESPYADASANIRHNTERLNRIIEGWIKEAPEQWLWLHKRWKVHDAPEGWDIPADLVHALERR